MSYNEKAFSYFSGEFHKWFVMNVCETEGFTLDDATSKAFDYQRLNALVKSPIEEQLGVALLFTTDGYKAIQFKFSPSEEVVPSDCWGSFFECQGNIGKYKADFLITVQCENRKTRIAIECDGHDFHEKTKEQAQKDKARDRFFVSEGVIVLRFTGSEIYRDVNKCTEEIGALAYRELEKLLIAAGHVEGES